MNYSVKLEDDILIFTLLESKLDTSNSGAMKTELTRTFTSREKFSAFVLDLSSVENCDSSGLSVLLVANRFAVERNYGFRIVTESPKILNLIKITRLDEVLIVAPDLVKARSEIRGI
ncbi:MAG: STAS domain-containing protein [Ignavibacteriaceae bacterium]|nr:STAS domain-containing protein [Ignavibacteriaceae bacterium]